MGRLRPTGDSTELTSTLTPVQGSRSAQYVYSVIYEDPDGPNGQAPEYVRVYIDGVAYDMTPAYTGTPPYGSGALYTYTPPSGLTGGSHKYHFEASDGAAVAWLDDVPPYSHQSIVGSVVSSVVDFNGPWVDNPPDLTVGAASPNPTSGSIATTESIDYTVTYDDMDNDPPYFYNPVTDIYDNLDGNGVPDGLDWSGSPRLWIDSGTTDQTYSGVTSALNDDPLAPGKKRIIVATTASGSNPNWTQNEFAGKLLQITNGALLNRVYLIQSNTANTLTLSTDDLLKDGVVAGGANASAFVINGLLLSKVDPTQQNYTQGIAYKVTVPGLAVGSHKFHFTARSRLTKPQWLQTEMLALIPPQMPVAYSSLARFPASGELTGPTVSSQPPTGVVAPTLTSDADHSLYVGPTYQRAAVTSPTAVGPINATAFALIREVRGVYMNANDFDLTAVPDSAANVANGYYDPVATTTPFQPGDQTIKRPSAIPASIAGAQIVQFAVPTLDTTTNIASLSSVTPDDPTVIDSRGSGIAEPGLLGH